MTTVPKYAYMQKVKSR